jgi:hypothetical protein
LIITNSDRSATAARRPDPLNIGGGGWPIPFASPPFGWTRNKEEGDDKEDEGEKEEDPVVEEATMVDT